MRVAAIGVGGDIGLYAWVRAWHELQGGRPTVLTKLVTHYVKFSRIMDVQVEPDLDNPEVLVAAINRIAGASPDTKFVVFTNSDFYVTALVNASDEFASNVVVPFCNADVLPQVIDKTSFADICARVGISTPKTVRADFASGNTQPVAEAISAAALGFPLVAKPATSAEYFQVEFPGKQKLYFINNSAELTALLETLASVRYSGKFLFQEFIPGDETTMRSLTAYRSRAGEVTLLAGGQVLVEEHSPRALGIPAAIITRVEQNAFDAAVSFLQATEYHGYANFDYKVDPRSGEPVFFEVNARIGRNNFYVTASGLNVVAPVLADYGLPGRLPATPVSSDRTVVYSVIPYRLLRKYLPTDLASEVRFLRKSGAWFNPLRYRPDLSWRRRILLRAIDYRYTQKFRQYYPAPTADGL